MWFTWISLSSVTLFLYVELTSIVALLQAVWKVFLKNHFSIFERSFLLNKKTSGDQGAVAKAKANIEEHFVVVGLLEKVIMGLLVEFWLMIDVDSSAKE